MKKGLFGRWAIEHDPEATAACYAALPVGVGCDCQGCRNFALVSDDYLPPEVRAQLESFGIDVRKPSEVLNLHATKDGGMQVVVWYHVVGRILSGSDSMVWNEDRTRGRFELERIDSRVEAGVTSEAHLYAPVFDAKPLLQFEIATATPWRLDEPNEYPE